MDTANDIDVNAKLTEISVTMKYVAAAADETKANVKSIDKRLQDVEAKLGAIKGVWLTVTFVGIIISMVAAVATAVVNFSKIIG